RPPPARRDPQQRLALPQHGGPVLVPVRVLPRDRPEVIDQWLHRVGHVDDLGVAVDLHPGPPEVVGQEQDAHRRRLRPAVGTCRHDDGVVPGPDEVEQLVSGDNRVRCDLGTHPFTVPSHPNRRPGPGGRPPLPKPPPPHLRAGPPGLVPCRGWDGSKHGGQYVTGEIRFGVVSESVPADGPAWVDQARRLEDAGVSSLLLRDHFSAAAFGQQLAPFSALAAAAAVTSQLRVGTLVLSNDFRHPAIVAHEAASLDHLTGGRFELGLGAGWYQPEYAAAGIPFDGARVRIDRLEES